MQINSNVLLNQRNILVVNRVIKNTYMLLSMTILFSAFTAYLSLLFNVKPVGFFLLFIVAISLLYFINKCKNNIFGLIGVFIFTGFMGYTIGPIINSLFHNSYGSMILLSSLLLTGISFSCLSVYALFNKRDFNFLSSFITIGVIIVIIGCIINLFFNIELVSVLISGFIVILSIGFILYDTSRLASGEETNYMLATLNLYLNIYNMFLSLLTILNYFTGNNE